MSSPTNFALPPTFIQNTISSPDLTLPNLRTLRNSQGLWQVWIDGHAITVSASPHTIHRDSGTSYWNIRLTGVEVVGKLLKVTSSSGTVKFDAEYGIIDLKVSGNWRCRPEDARVPVQLQLEFQDDKGQILSRQINADYTCLLGDILEDTRADSLVKITHQNWKDPYLVQLLAKAPKSKRKLIDELKYLKSHFSETTYQVDPEDDASGWQPGRAYALSPSDIFRYGGDCEDYSMLIGAYLTQRGYPSWMVSGLGHVWVEVIEDGQRKVVDILDSNPKFREVADRAFIGLPP